MKKNFSVLLLLRKNTHSCKKFYKFIVSKSKKTSVIWTDAKSKRNFIDKIKKKFDYIISYRSNIILKKKNLKLAKIAAINLHPGPPNYRGIGCLNYAIYNGEKKYGFTIHLMNERIDNGKILFVKRFPIKKYITVKALLGLTHAYCYKYSKLFFSSILKDSKQLEFFKEKYKKEKWSKIINSKKFLENFYQIKNFNKKEVQKKINATVYKNYLPFIKIGKHQFILKVK